jgi:hypothetical protein
MRGALQGDTGVPQVVATYYELRRNHKCSHATAEELIRNMGTERWTEDDIPVGIQKGKTICVQMGMS